MIYIQFAKLWHVCSSSCRNAKWYVATFKEQLAAQWIQLTKLLISPEAHHLPWYYIPLQPPPIGSPFPAVSPLLLLKLHVAIGYWHRQCQFFEHYAFFLCIFCGSVLGFSCYYYTTVFFVNLFTYSSFWSWYLRSGEYSYNNLPIISRVQRPKPTIPINVTIHTNKWIVEINPTLIKYNKQKYI